MLICTHIEYNYYWRIFFESNKVENYRFLENCQMEFAESRRKKSVSKVLSPRIIKNGSENLPIFFNAKNRLPISAITTDIRFLSTHKKYLEIFSRKTRTRPIFEFCHVFSWAMRRIRKKIGRKRVSKGNHATCFSSRSIE